MAAETGWCWCHRVVTVPVPLCSPGCGAVSAVALWVLPGVVFLLLGPLHRTNMKMEGFLEPSPALPGVWCVQPLGYPLITSLC